MRILRVTTVRHSWTLLGFLLLLGCSGGERAADDALCGASESVVSGASAGDALNAGEPSPGRGLYPVFSREHLAEVGWPNDLNQPYWWPESTEGEWGILYDDEGVPYGPNTYYHFRKRLDHPDFALTDSTMTGRWFSINRHERSEEVMFGRWLELHELAHQEMVERLLYVPPTKILLYVAPTLEDYKAVTGKDYWVTQVADGPFIAYEPMRVLWSRTLAPHAVRNGVVLAFLDLKCHGLVPPWLRQGLASYLAQEGGPLDSFAAEFRVRREVLWSPQQVMQHIDPLYERENGRIALYNAFLMTWNLAESYGWNKIQDLLDLMEQGMVFEEAVPQAYGVSAARLLELLDPRGYGDPTLAPSAEDATNSEEATEPNTIEGQNR